MRKSGVYLAMGDSITWTMPMETNPVGSALYVHRLHKAISQSYGPIKLINKGLGGQDSGELVANIKTNTVLNPDLVTIGIGMNDCVASSTITTTQYKANLNKVIDALKLRNPNVIIILCTPSRTNDANRTAKIQSFRDAMAQVVTERNDSKIALCKFEDAFTDVEVTTYCADTPAVHPNMLGHGKLYDVLWPVVQNVASNWLQTLGK